MNFHAVSQSAAQKLVNERYAPGRLKNGRYWLMRFTCTAEALEAARMFEGFFIFHFWRGDQDYDYLLGYVLIPDPPPEPKKKRSKKKVERPAKPVQLALF